MKRLQHDADDRARCRRRPARRSSAATAGCRSWSLPLLSWRGVDDHPLRQAGRASRRACRRPSPRRSWSCRGRRAGSGGSPALPAVRRIAEPPARSMPANECGRRPRGARRRRPATLPSVRFLKPIGIDRPEASWRCVWLSVVRAPIAPQATVSAMYCGVIGSRNSQPTGSPSVEDVEEQAARGPQAGVDVAGAVEVRVVDQALPAGRRARLLEVDAHHDEQVGQPGGQRGEAGA